jgi:hypothetical protein
VSNQVAKPETNVEFVTRIMEFCPKGALGQAFVIEAIARYAGQVAAAPAFKDNDLLSGEAWKEIGVWLKGELDAKYGGRKEAPTPQAGALGEKQITAIRCAHADLQGALQAHENADRMGHDWDAHQLTIGELEDAFPFLNQAG